MRQVAFALAFFATVAAQPVAALSANRPNIILVVADDLGYGEIGCFGQQIIRTPNIDRMAAEGLRFTQFYAGCSVCSPSRCALLTGRHTGHCTVRGNAANAREAIRQALLPPDYTLGEMMRDAGYTTGFFGKWHLSGCDAVQFPESSPLAQGFDAFFGQLDPRQQLRTMWPAWVWNGQERFNLPNVVQRSGVATLQSVYADDLFTDKVLEFIATAERPFFLTAMLRAPHANESAKKTLANGTEVPSLGIYDELPWPAADKGHAAMITRLDGNVGRILDAVRALDDRNTLVMFTSDNGPHNESGHDLKRFNPAGPLRGIKRSLNEGGIRVPCIAWMPGVIAAGSVTTRAAYFPDLMPTLADLADVDTPPTDGTSFLPTLRGQPQPEAEWMYWEIHEGYRNAALWQGRWKILQSYGKAPEVFDVKTDPGERKNLAKKLPALTASLQAAIPTMRMPNPLWPWPGE